MAKENDTLDITAKLKEISERPGVADLVELHERTRIAREAAERTQKSAARTNVNVYRVASSVADI